MKRYWSSSVYKDRIKELWGRYPLDVYASTEGGIIATQTWDYGSMTFIPTLNFYEFIPDNEHWKWQLDHSYQPKTVLFDEVKAGENYELVITNLHGGALTRYRIGDMIRITTGVIKAKERAFASVEELKTTLLRSRTPA